MSNQMRVAAAFLLLLAVTAVAAQQPAPAGAAVGAPQSQAQADGPNDVHVYVAKVAESKPTANTLINIENKFAQSHSRVMNRLNTVLKRVTDHIQGPKAVLMETEAEGVVIPTIDGTGGDRAIRPSVNTTRFSVKPKIDATLVKDLALAALLETEATKPGKHGKRGKPIVDDTGSLAHTPKANTTRFSVKPKIDATLVKDLALTALLETELEIAPILDGTGSDSFTPKANLTRFSVKPKIDSSFVVDLALTALLETEVDIDAEEELEAQTEAEDEEFVETEGVVIPTIDGTGSLAGAPRVDTTRFSVKPKIDATLVKDLALTALLETEITKPGKHGKHGKPIVDGTGSLAHTPKANTTRFSVKPKIDATLVKDAGLSLLQTSSRDCPTCRNRGIKQNLEVVLSPVNAPNAMDKPLIEQQHNAINYLLPKEVKAKLSVTQSNLDAANTAVVEAAGAHERFYDFTEKHKNMPLIPQL